MSRWFLNQRPRSKAEAEARGYAFPGANQPTSGNDVPWERAGIDMDWLTRQREWTHEPLEHLSAETEKGYAIRLARLTLDAADAAKLDPDGDLCVLARQFLRALGLI